MHAKQLSLEANNGAIYHGFYMAAQRRYRFRSASADSSSQIAPNRE